MKRGSQKQTLLVGAILLFALSGISLIHLAGGIDNFVKLVSEIDSSVLVAMLFLLLAEIVKSVRLVVFSSSNGARVRLHWAIISRLVGRFFGILTPAYSGATPARAAVIASTSGMEAGAAFGLTTMESLFDTFLPVGVTFLLTLPLLPATWLPFLTSLFLGTLWVGGIVWAKTEKFVNFIERRFGAKGYACYLIRQRDHFFKSLSSIVRNRLIFTVGGTLTLVAHLLETYSIIVLSRIFIVPGTWSALEQLWKAFLALEISNVMIMSPTPGGALFFEYGLAGVLEPSILVWWRIIYILFSLIPGLFLLLLIGRVRSYAKHVLEAEVKKCD